MFDKQIFDGPCRDTVGHRQDFGFQGLLCFHTTHSPYSLQISLLMAEMLHLYQALYLNSLDILRRKEGGKKEVFLSFLFLGNNQPKIILMPKRHILMWQILVNKHLIGHKETVNHKLAHAKSIWQWLKSNKGFATCLCRGWTLRGYSCWLSAPPEGNSGRRVRHSPGNWWNKSLDS